MGLEEGGDGPRGGRCVCVLCSQRLSHNDSLT